ncbi:ArsR/SmtB family transcription factor [Aquabacter cavernae]|uniref:ArsR/SmtB family transcription factor n=1 Tax=Aquabacter cavernae TaxID=2496029 RepID=UPI000F8ED992|nr:winged helix-turn-helix domain-containing protein [Aquabacter cavernae]
MSSIASGNTIAEVGGLMGDAARANMLMALMGGQALTAGELARVARITPQTASGHLAKMIEGRLLAVEKQGRHRYYRLASGEVAHAMQALMALAADGHRRHHPLGPRDAALRLARTCYDHMAGRLAVAIADALSAQDCMVLSDGAAVLTQKGRAVLDSVGLPMDGTSARRPLCRTCLDWSERRPRLAGRLGAALLARALDLGWIVRTPGNRALTLTGQGEEGFRRAFSLPVDWRAGPSP